MKKILAASLCALLSMGLLLSCNEKAEKKVNLIYSVNAVPGDAHYDAMMKFKEVVEAESNGNITVTDTKRKTMLARPIQTHHPVHPTVRIS